MKKLTKRILSVILALAVLAGCVTGGVALWNKRNSKAIKIYPITSFSMTEYWGDSTTTDGLVGVEGLQTVLLSDTQTVTEVLVQPGEQVQAGDPLLTYDTTLTELDLQKKDVSVKQLELELTEAQKELATIKTYKPGVYIPGSVTTTVIPGIPPVEEPPFVDDGTLTLLSGDGSAADPFVYPWSEEYTFTDALFYQCMRGLDDAYVLFEADGAEPESDHVPDAVGWYTDTERHWQVCATCGVPFQLGEHLFSPVVDQPATMTEPGLQHEACVVCGYVKEDSEQEIPPLEHEHQASTQWGGNKSSHWHLCVLCGEKMDQAGHDLRWVIDQEPTETQAGQKHPECDICGYRGPSQEIPATGDSGEEPDDPSSPETPDEEGNTKPDGPQDDTKPDGQQDDTKPDESQNSGDQAETAPTVQLTSSASPAPNPNSPGEDTPQEEDPQEVPEDGEEETPPEEETPGTPEEEPIRAKWLMQFQKTDLGYTYQLLAIQVGSELRMLGQPLPPLPEKEPSQGIPSQTITSGVKYTKEEITQMRTEAEMKVKETDLNLRKAQLDYEKAEQELNNGAVYSELDGKVSSVLTEEEARTSGEPMIQVTAGGGYVIQGSVSELLRDSVQPGQTVTLRSWESGTECQGTVQEISDYPTQGSFWNGNTNVSLYPFTVSVPEDAGLRQGEYVEITYGASQQASNTFYLESMFIRAENGKNYVYVADDQGKLEKRYISTGKSVWGSYTEIKSGLTQEDYVAFPYGDGLKDGANTEVSTIEEFYGW